MTIIFRFLLLFFVTCFGASCKSDSTRNVLKNIDAVAAEQERNRTLAQVTAEAKPGFNISYLTLRSTHSDEKNINARLVITNITEGGLSIDLINTENNSFLFTAFVPRNYDIPQLVSDDGQTTWFYYKANNIADFLVRGTLHSISIVVDSEIDAVIVKLKTNDTKQILEWNGEGKFI